MDTHNGAPPALQKLSAIEGVNLIPLPGNHDQRGTFTEIFRRGWRSGIEPVQWSLVQSEPRVLRGMHLHLRHDEYFLLIQGRCVVGLRDIRKNSPTRDATMTIELTADPLTALIFPPGVLHGWYFHERSAHIQAVSECYDEYNPDDNWGCLWSDPDLGLVWADSDPVISPRAAAFPPLKVLQRALENARSSVSPLPAVALE
jgi:dTDP-4-dehydrorhamnose 3,5-epimerase